MYSRPHRGLTTMQVLTSNSQYRPTLPCDHVSARPGCSLMHWVPRARCPDQPWPVMHWVPCAQMPWCGPAVRPGRHSTRMPCLIVQLISFSTQLKESDRSSLSHVTDHGLAGLNANAWWPHCGAYRGEHDHEALRHSSVSADGPSMASQLCIHATWAAAATVDRQTS